MADSPRVYAQLQTIDGARPLLMGARAVALGDAYTADNSDVSALYWNPGALYSLENASVVVDEYYEVETAINNDMAAVAIPRVNEGTVALGVSVSHVGYIKTNHPNNYHAAAYGFDIGYATSFSPGFSAGLRFHGQFGHTQGTNLLTNNWSLGLLYRPSSEIAYGLTYGGVGDGLFIADSVTMIREVLPHRLEIGIAMRYPAGRSHQLIMISLSNEKIFGETGLYYKAGMEILPYEFLALRFGYNVGPVTQTPRLGAGLRTDMFRLDYAIAPSTQSLRFQQITLSLNI
ncbi:MAG: hypothetical protein ACHQQQ_02350 [Bacteroidota bacterium]